VLDAWEYPGNRAAWDWYMEKLDPKLAIGLSEAALNPNNEERIYADAVSSGLLPDPKRQFGLSWGQVRARVPKYEGEKLANVNRDQIDELLISRDKKEFQKLSEELWPPRTKSDLSLRRTRLLDYVIHCRRVGILDDLKHIMYMSKEGWDLIWITNLIVCMIVFGREWISRWEWLGAFDGDLVHFNAVTKKVNNLGKTVGLQDKNFRNYVECTVMGGYRNPPYPGFDVVEETIKLAHGGDEHNYFGHTWTNLVEEFLPMDFHPKDYISFKDFVVGAEWLTTGASSVGRVEIEMADGEKIRVKARKNMVADVYDLNVLASEAIESKTQQNYTIVKSELGKLRLAVAGDIYTYLKMTWITYLLGGAYYDWPGNTTEETFEEQTVRLAKMLELAREQYGLPYDYDGFDHQPTTRELIGIASRLVKHAAFNVPPDEMAMFNEIADNVVQGFNHSTLSVRKDNGDTEEFAVTGGLMSGLRWTSIVGNAWNSVMTGLVLKVLNSWGIDTDKVERYIRGDDSAIYVPNWATGAATNLAYDAVGAKGGEGKFSLQLHKMEFLRVWFDKRCYGYGPRALPGLTQRKPWSSEPWSEDMTIKAIYEATRTLRRRVPDRIREIDSLWKTLARIWTQNHNLPDAAVWISKSCGGLGIEQSAIGEVWKLEPPIPVQSTDKGLIVTNQNDWREKKITEYFNERYEVDIGERAKVIAAEEIASTITADNIPSVAKNRRQQWLSEVRSNRSRVMFKRRLVSRTDTPVDVPSYEPEEIVMLEERLKVYTPLFGKYPEVAIARKDYNQARLNMSFSEWLRKYFPSIWNDLKTFHRSWHRTEALDYLEGKIELAPKILHPALVGILASVVAINYKPKKRVDRESLSWATALFEPWVYGSKISQKTYQW
jgi:hypothetical protein